jgi:CheY-like chemotaxis protein
MMPYKDGIETLRELRSLHDSPNADTPTICLTANAISGMRDMYISAGFDDYLTKPIDPGSLEDTLIKFLPREKVMAPQGSGHELTDKDVKLPEFLYEIRGLDVDTGLLHLGDKTFYLETLRTYQESVEITASEMDRFWNEKNIPNLTTKIHAVKSTSRIIGATGLGALAEMLEKAGKDGNEGLLEANLDKLISDYRRLGKELSPLAQQEPTEDEKLILNRDELEAFFTRLKEAYDCSDYGEMEVIGDHLARCRVPDDEKDRVEAIVRAISDFDYDEVPSMLNIC